MKTIGIVGGLDLVGELLAAQAKNLQAAGADFFLVACNTVHTAAERIEQLADLPFLHIVDPTARQIQQAGFSTVGQRSPTWRRAALRSSSWPAPSSAWSCRPGTARYRSSTRPSPTPRPPSRWH